MFKYLFFGLAIMTAVRNQCTQNPSGGTAKDEKCRSCSNNDICNVCSEDYYPDTTTKLCTKVTTEIPYCEVYSARKTTDT